MDGNLPEKKLFYELKTQKDVAALIGCKERSLRYFLYAGNCIVKYRTFTLKKRDGSQRIISAPIPPLKKIQRKLANILNVVYKPKACVYGFVPKKNFIENAKQHVGCKYILNIDLKNFFNQIHFGRVRGVLMAKPYQLSQEAAGAIAQLVCFNGILPQGAPSSPILTNMVCRSFDNELMKFAAKNGIKYTRYADDITFSSYRNKIPEELAIVTGNNVRLGTALEKLLEKNNFEINPNKIYLFLKNQHQEVTGLTVNTIVNINRKYLRLLRVILYNCDKKNIDNPIYESAKRYIELGNCKNNNIIKLVKDDKNKEKIEKWFKQVLIGKVRFIKQVKGENSFSYHYFATRINKILKKTIFDLSLFNYANMQIQQNVFIVEAGTNQGSGFYLKGYGFITCYHVVEKEKEEKEEKKEKICDCVFYLSFNRLKVLSKCLKKVLLIFKYRFIVYKLGKYNIKPTLVEEEIKEKIKEEEIYKSVDIYRCINKSKLSFKRLKKEEIILKDKFLDYVLYKLDVNDINSAYKIGNSEKVEIGDEVTIIGFPNYVEQDTFTLIKTHITSKSKFMEAPVFVVDSKICHGTSGGAVLNKDSEIIGLVIAGSDDTAYELKNALVPIHEILRSLRLSKQ